MVFNGSVAILEGPTQDQVSGEQKIPPLAASTSEREAEDFKMRVEQNGGEKRC